MKYSDLLQLFFERSNALQTFWAIWVAVVTALLAVCAVRERLTLKQMVILTVGFCFFAAVNANGMRDVSVQRYAAMEAVKKCPVPEAAEEKRNVEATRVIIEPTLDPPHPWQVMVFHAIVDALVLAGMWTISFHKWKSRGVANGRGYEPQAASEQVAAPERPKV